MRAIIAFITCLFTSKLVLARSNPVVRTDITEEKQWQESWQPGYESGEDCYAASPRHQHHLHQHTQFYVFTDGHNHQQRYYITTENQSFIKSYVVRWLRSHSPLETRVGMKISMIYINDISWYFQAKILWFFLIFSKYQPLLVLFTYISNSCISNTNCPSL